MIPKRLEKITADDIRALVQNERPEGDRLDYKSSLPATGGKTSHALLADVAAFANTYGGDIIYGISERRDSDGQPTGVPKKIEGLGDPNHDQERRRLQDALYRGLDPAVRVAIKFVDGFDGGPVAILRVDQTLNGPVMIKPNHRFYVRSGSQNRLLERTQDLRALFAGRTNIAQALRGFRSDRLAILARNEGPMAMPENLPLLVVHAVPYSLAVDQQELGLDLLSQASSDMNLFPGGWSHRPNLDGFLIFPGVAEDFYTQLFRTGAIEIVDGDLGPLKIETRIASGYLSKYIKKYCSEALTGLHSLQITPPILLSASLLNVEGWQLDQWSRTPVGFEHFQVTAEAEISEWGDEPKSVGILSILDRIWQAAGYSEYSDQR